MPPAALPRPPDAEVDDADAAAPRAEEPDAFVVGVRPDAVAVRALDVRSVGVIATVMGQTVALDHYSAMVDQMLETFTRLNASVERTGVCSAMEKQSLFRLVAQNNTMFTDVISKIGLLERSDAAWHFAAHSHVWEGLREEFDLEDRFKHLEFKLNLIQHNTKFFLEVMHNQKSDTLEWIIIVLISAEICIGLCDLFNIRPV